MQRAVGLPRAHIWSEQTNMFDGEQALFEPRYSVSNHNVCEVVIKLRDTNPERPFSFTPSLRFKERAKCVCR